MLFRAETSKDIAAIHSLIRAAFLDAKYTNGTEAEIVDRLRDDGALSLSLVAVRGDKIVGHVAFSPVSIGDTAGWYGLGPLAVIHDERRQGVAAKLVTEGLAILKKQGAGGCVVLGDPNYYSRFGFACDPAVSLAGIPPEYFRCVTLCGPNLKGPVTYHPAFEAA